MDGQALIDALDNAGFDARSYSGRGMFGKECVGVVLDSDGDLWTLAQNLALEGVELRSPRTDSMGLGQIAYWPSVAWPSEAA